MYSVFMNYYEDVSNFGDIDIVLYPRNVSLWCFVVSNWTVKFLTFKRTKILCLIPKQLELNSTGISITENEDEPTTEAVVKFNDDVRIKEKKKN